MFKALLKARLLGMLNAISHSRKSKPVTAKKAASLFILLIAIIFIAVFNSFYALFTQLCNSFAAADMIWAFFSVFFILSLFMILIGSAFIVKTTLFDSKDNEFLLSMPIPPSYILITRLIVVLIYNYLFAFALIAPALLAFINSGTASAQSIFIFIILSLTMPLFATACSTALAWLIARLSIQIRNKTLSSFILYFSLIGFYLLINILLSNFTSVITENPDGIFNLLKAFPPIALIGEAIAGPNYLYALIFSLFFCGVFALSITLLSKNYVKIMTTKRGHKRITYKGGGAKQKSAFIAMLSRDFKRLFSSPVYVLNSCFGLVFLYTLTVVYVLGGCFGWFSELITGLQGEFGISKNLIAAVMILPCVVLNSMTLITPASISIEGKTIWILRCLPFDEKYILHSKLSLQILLTLLPSIIISISAVVIAKVNGLMLILVLFTPALHCIFTAVLGLVEGIRRPVMDWTNETTPVKNSIAVLFTMLIGWLAIGVHIFVYASTAKFNSDPFYVLLSFAVITTISTILLYRYLMTHGIKRLRELT